jgi:hypothetical protein
LRRPQTNPLPAPTKSSRTPSRSSGAYGWSTVIGSAFTFSLNPDRYENLIKAAKAATETGIREAGIDALGSDLLDLVIEVASGRLQTKAQQLGQADFQPWKRGVSL